MKREIAKIYKSESGRVLASLVRILGDFDLAEDALQEAFNVALEKWPKEGIPKNRYSWLISTGKFKAIDSIRRLGRGRELLAEKLSLNKELKMQFFVYFTMKEGEPMTPPSPEGMAKMGKFMEESFKSGKIVATGQLPRETTQVQLDRGNFSVSDGPFIEGKELIPGFTVISVDSKQEAIEWTKELRECMGDGVLKLAKLSATSREEL